MRKAPSNLFASGPTKNKKAESSEVPPKTMRASTGGKGGRAKEGIWVGVHEINDLAKASTVRPRSVARLHQEELRSLGADGPKKGATPPKIGRGMYIKKKQLAQKLRARDRDVGNQVEKKVEDYWDNKLEKDEYLRKIKGNRSGLSRGNKINTDALVGKFRDGVLTISKEDIEAVRANRKK